MQVPRGGLIHRVAGRAGIACVHVERLVLCSARTSGVVGCSAVLVRAAMPQGGAFANPREPLSMSSMAVS
eukprot:3668350-Prymnesium_polylepis.1